MSRRKMNYLCEENIDSDDDNFDFRVYNDVAVDLESSYSDSSDNDILVPGRRRRKIRKLSSNYESADDGEPQEENLTKSICNVRSSDWQEIFNEDITPQRFEFSTGTKTPGPQVHNLCEPVEYFQLFFTNALIEDITLETNSYAKHILRDRILSKCSIWNDWCEVEFEEMKAFLGVVLNMGTIYLSQIQNYWSKEFETRIPFFSKIFSRKRFLQIFWMLHLNENASKAQDIRTRVQKVNNFIEYLDEKFREYFVPGKEVSINEAVVKVKGRISFINYNPQKPTKWGIRIFVLADAKSAYVYGILPYYGELTSQDLIKPDLPVSSRIVLHLCNKLLHSVPGCAGYHVYTDRYCTSLVLAEELLQIKCHITGTIQKNRKHIPQGISNPKFINSNTIAMRHSNYLLLAWKNKRIVTMLSTYHTFGSRVIISSSRNCTIEEASKPNIIADYTSNKGGVDKSDQYASTYCFLRKSLKWWRKLFFWGLETSVINAYILYKISQERKGESALSHYKFVKLLVSQLVSNFRSNNAYGRPSGTDREQRLDGKLHIINQLPKGKKKKCLVCSPKGSNAVKKQTVFYCETCERKPGLHPNECFKKFHTLLNYN